MKYRSRQEIFNVAYKGLRKQKFGKSTDGNACVYLAEDGNKCAIGHCIRSNKYSPDFEETSFSDGQLTSIHYDILDAAKISAADVEFVKDLQLAHDNSTDYSSEMKRRLREVALNYGLTVPK